MTKFGGNAENGGAFKPTMSMDRLIDSMAQSFKARPIGNWVYQDPDGSEVMRVLRFNLADGSKQYRPISRDPGTDRWRIGDPPDRPLPLYGLIELGTSERVWVCEGEKCVDAARTIGLVATTSAHGSQSAAKTDWSPLAGREVIILPDNDTAGAHYAQDVVRILMSLAPRPRVKIVKLDGLAPKGDLYDWLEAHDTVEPETLSKMIRQMVMDTPLLDPSEWVGGAKLISLSGVEMREVRWLWPSRIARGKLSLIAGDPGVGKSFLTLDLAARVSKGSEFPDGSSDPSGAGHVVLISAEDDLEDTIYPRLQRAGAEMSRVTWLEAVKRITPEGTQTSLLTLEDLSPLRDALMRVTDPKLVVIDPISAYLGECDGNNNAQVRGMLGELSRLAREFGCAIVMVTHLNKSKDGANARARSLYRAMGSLAFVAAARCAMLACKDPKDPARRMLLPMKNNLGNDSDGLAWRIEDGAVEWEPDPIVLTADDAMQGGTGSDGLPTVMSTVTDWLKIRLTPGALPATTIREEALEHGFSLTTLDRARIALRIVTRKVGGLSGHWMWGLSEEAITGQMGLAA